MRVNPNLFTEGPIDSPTLNVMGLALAFLSPGLFLAGIVEWISATSHNEWPLFASAAISLNLGLTLRALTEISDEVKPLSMFSMVAWSWVACSFMGSLPYLWGGVFSWSNFDGALFESISGFSTSGSTVLEDIESLGKGMLFWRQLTQWYGGMGMIVLATAVLPRLGVGGLALMSKEATGHKSDMFRASATKTAKTLWTVYFAFTVAIAIALWIAPGPTLFDAITHALSTAATGGFSTYNSSVGYFDSVAVEIILILAMLFGAISYTLHYRAFAQRERYAWFRSSETRVFLGVTFTAALLVTLINTSDDLGSFTTVLRDSVFNVVSLATSTGFSNARPEGIGDFVLWGAASQILILFLMTVGGTTGSTAGGMKVLRLQIGLKALKRELRLFEHRKGIFPITMGREPVSDRIISSALAFVALFISFVILGTIAISALGNDLITSASGVISAMSNMGPALGDAGPTSNFLSFSRPARSILAFLMILGRLEIYAVLLMLVAPANRILIRK